MREKDRIQCEIDAQRNALEKEKIANSTLFSFEGQATFEKQRREISIL